MPFSMEYYSSSLCRWLPSSMGPLETLEECFENIRILGRKNYRAVCLETGQTYFISKDDQLQPFPTETQEAQIMPINTTTAPVEHSNNSLVKINVTREKPSNKLILTIDAKPLHDLLDSIGVPLDSTGLRYSDRPSCSFEIVRDSLLSSELFLKREYPVRANLSAIWSQPPTIQRLRDICNSAHEVVRKILAHYQPIDISVTIQKMVIS